MVESRVGDLEPHLPSASFMPHAAISGVLPLYLRTPQNTVYVSPLSRFWEWKNLYIKWTQFWPNLIRLLGHILTVKVMISFQEHISIFPYFLWWTCITFIMYSNWSQKCSWFWIQFDNASAPTKEASTWEIPRTGLSSCGKEAVRANFLYF